MATARGPEDPIERASGDCEHLHGNSSIKGVLTAFRGAIDSISGEHVSSNLSLLALFSTDVLDGFCVAHCELFERSEHAQPPNGII